MPRILHILTTENDPLAGQIIRQQCQQPDQQVVTVDLTVSAPDYPALLREVFAADSVEVW